MVVAILGLAAGAVVLSVPDPRPPVGAEAERFAIHVLPAEDRAMSDRFAWGACRLTNDEFESDVPEPPRLRNALVRLDCRAYSRTIMGDHLVIVGEVVTFEHRAGAALTYYRGRYGVAEETA